MKNPVLIQSSFVFYFLTTAQNINAFPFQATIEHGTMEGNYYTKTDIQTNLGVPFAQPPTYDKQSRIMDLIEYLVCILLI